MFITMLNIQQTDKFFGTVNRCAGPVTVKTADGRREDIRNNALVRELLVNAGARGGISRLELHVETHQDFKNVFRYMLESHLS